MFTFVYLFDICVGKYPSNILKTLSRHCIRKISYVVHISYVRHRASDVLFSPLILLIAHFHFSLLCTVQELFIVDSSSLFNITLFLPPVQCRKKTPYNNGVYKAVSLEQCRSNVA